MEKINCSSVFDFALQVTRVRDETDSAAKVDKRASAQVRSAQ